jgi:hypothetical protein
VNNAKKPQRWARALNGSARGMGVLRLLYIERNRALVRSITSFPYIVNSL